MKMVFQDTLRSLINRTEMNDRLERRLSVLSPDDFVRMVAEANDMCDTLVSKGTYQFVFPKDPPKHVFWRLSVEIFCRFVSLLYSVPLLLRS